ncbi:MAG: nucleoside monophosphate kinase [Candidatus Gracilibacteria bacterium]|nr:nucleoside monophosphate kinase [Candidatus Gracilibacteria bacterium]
MKLVFTGIQGCGKGTQARLLVEKYGFTLLEMGGEFRKIINSGTELGNEIKKIIDAGFQVPGELGIKVMETAINNNLNNENIVYDAFVRNEWNKEIFDRLLPDYKVIFFELPIEKAKNRLLGRMYDEKTGETFPSGTTINPVSGDKLIKRNDDKDEGAILNRISEFESKTLPIVELQKNENRVITVNADQAIENVFKELITKLGL